MSVDPGRGSPTTKLGSASCTPTPTRSAKNCVVHTSICWRVCARGHIPSQDVANGLVSFLVSYAICWFASRRSELIYHANHTQWVSVVLIYRPDSATQRQSLPGKRRCTFQRLSSGDQSQQRC